ncbi:hypothetical protein [Microcoleus sp. CAWBG640]
MDGTGNLADFDYKEKLARGEIQWFADRHELPNPLIIVSYSRLTLF